MAEHTPIPEHVAPTEEVGDRLPIENLDPTKPIIVSAWGRKGSGKSTFNRRLFRSWPFDKLCIDVNGDADPGPVEPIHAPLPARFPAPPAPMPGAAAQRYRSLYWRADPGSPTYDDDLDRAIGLALFPQDRKKLVWAGEVGDVLPSAQKTRPHMRRLLMQNRHFQESALFDGPRPANVNPLVLGQSDLVAIYLLPNADDRERIAKTIGYPADRFEVECETTWRRGPYWFLLWVAAEHQLYRCAPLPED